MVSVQIKKSLGRFLIFGMLGLIFEVVFVAISRLVDGNLEMRGFTSVWMVFDYGLLGLVLMPLARPMMKKGVPLALRATVYMLGIFFVEFVSGAMFNWFGLKLWDYSHLPYNLFGYITLTYIPIWLGLGFLAEYLYHKVDIIVLALISD